MTSPRQAAVLVPVLRCPQGVLRVVLIRRVDAGLHPGQISFPGGGREPADASLAATAVRETSEELGVAVDRIEIVRPLPRVRTRSTDFEIHPFLGQLRRPPAWSPQPTEVAEVLEIALNDLADPRARRRARVQPPGWALAQTVPCFRVGEAVIWGATYRILEPLIVPLRDAVWPIGE